MTYLKTLLEYSLYQPIKLSYKKLAESFKFSVIQKLTNVNKKAILWNRLTLYICKVNLVERYGLGMNITLRKMALLEQTFLQQEELAKIQGYSNCPIDNEMKRRVTNLMDKVRLI